MSESYWAAWLFTRHETEETGAEDTWDEGPGRSDDQHPGIASPGMAIMETPALTH